MVINKRNRRLIALVMAVLLVTLVGCSSTGKEKNSSGISESAANSGTSTSGSGSSAFDLWLGWAATINNDSLVQQYWRDKEPGVEVKLEATQGDAMTALNLKLNAGGFKDAAMFSRNDTVLTAMTRSGMIMPLEQYFDMPDKYPGLASIPKVYIDRLKDKDGHIWSIPTWFDQNPDNPWPGWSSNSWVVRTDVVEKAGMTLDDLSTIEGVEEFLREAAKIKDDSGKPLLPLSFLMDQNDNLGYSDENAVLNAFGVSTGGAGIEKKGEEFIFAYDNPNYKKAYQWMNKMYREKLIDPEVVTSKKEQYQERNQSGRVAMNVGSFFNIPSSAWEALDGPTAPGWYYQVIPIPKVPDVDQVGINQVVNPYPGYDVFVNKDTKNLDAVLKFFDYTLQPNPEQQHVVNEGPAGLYWDWVDQPLGKWNFTDPEYDKARNSGDVALKSKVTPELYMTSSFSNEWYPWWNVGNHPHAGYKKTTEFTEAVGKMGAVRSVHSYDMVKMKTGGVWEKSAPTVENLRKEYRAKLLMAQDDGAFEKVWNEFRGALEKRGQWNEMKAEWHETYQAEIQVNGEF